VFLTYPFVDSAVGRNPQVARNLHMGDYTNLNARLDINVTSPPVLPTLPTILPTTLPSPIVNACIAVKKQVSAAAGRAVKGLPTPPFTKKQKAAIKKRIVRRVMASIDCKNPGNIPAKVAKALAQILKDGIPGVPLPHITEAAVDPGRDPAQPAGWTAQASARRHRVRPGGRPGHRRRLQRTSRRRGRDRLQLDARGPPAAGGAGPMITTRTKRQLMVFVLITLIGVSYVGARYARLDRLFLDTSYSVDAHFVDSGGIFTGAEVTYRGVRVGQVSAMHLTRDGVDVVMAIDKGNDTIPRETRALVGNKSASRRAVRRAAAPDQRQAVPRRRLGDLAAEHRDPGVDHRAAHEPGQHGQLRAAGRPAHRSVRDGRGVPGHGARPRADHRHLQRVHRDRRRELRHHDGPDP
jgi:hypothetical protein